MSGLETLKCFVKQRKGASRRQIQDAIQGWVGMGSKGGISFGMMNMPIINRQKEESEELPWKDFENRGNWNPQY